MNKKILKLFVYIIILGFVGWGIYAIATAPKIPESEIVSKNGLHRHAHVTIKVNGKDVEIPTNIGVTGTMGANGEPMELHTHDTSGVVHAEFAGIVSKDQLHIGNFFKIWGQDFSKNSILGNKVDATHHITMTVDGVPNTDFENYSITGKGNYDAGGLGKIDDIVISYQ